MALFVILLFVWGLAALMSIVGPLHNRGTRAAVLVAAGACLLFFLAEDAFRNPLVIALPPQYCLVGIRPCLKFDWLSGWFLAVLAFCTIAISLYAPSYMNHLKPAPDMRIYWVGFVVLLAAMCGVLLAADAITFLICWEAMALSSAMLVLTNHQERATRTTGLIYIAATRISTLFLAAAFLWIHGITHSWSFAVWHLTGQIATWPAILLVIGIAIKAGCWPFHLWLPAAHPAAPAPVSALMSGVMVKTAIYAFLRFFIVQRAIQSTDAAYLLLTLGLITAFWGVLFTLLQRDLKRLLAYSTVENIGVITCAIGMSMVAFQFGYAGIGLTLEVAALFGVLSHALFKSTLFLAAGAVDIAADCHNIDKLGGLGRRMPRTFLCTLAAAASFCALPPMAGFATEWMLFHGSLLLALDSHQPALRMGALLLVGWLSLVGALAMATCIRFVGVVFLGRARSLACQKAHECNRSMQAGMALTAVMSVVTGITAAAIIGELLHAINHGGPQVLAVGYSLPMGQFVLLALASAGLLTSWLAYHDRTAGTADVQAWDCGSGGLTARMQATAESFAQPIARLFGNIYRYAIEVEFDGASPRLFPEHITVETHADATMESRVYAPIVRIIDRLGGLIAQLQTGSIHTYLLTMFATLLLLLAVAGYYR